MSSNTPTKQPTGDVAIVCSKDERGRLLILRRRSDDAPVEAGIAQPLVHGRPITGEVISMRRRDDHPFAFDVTTELARPEASRRDSDGPAQIATESYRRGWDAIWGSDGTVN